MQLCTTSETISFDRNLEEKSGEFYQVLSQKYEQGKELSRFKEENRKFALQIQRAYQSVITDAIEGCFAFKLESSDYTIDTELPEELSFLAPLKRPGKSKPGLSISTIPPPINPWR